MLRKQSVFLCVLSPKSYNSILCNLKEFFKIGCHKLYGWYYFYSTNQEYTEFFGGTTDTTENVECNLHRLGLFNGSSQAINSYEKLKHEHKLEMRDVANEMNNLNAKLELYTCVFLSLSIILLFKRSMGFPKNSKTKSILFQIKYMKINAVADKTVSRVMAESGFSLYWVSSQRHDFGSR